jgi:hypothetical protein
MWKHDYILGWLLNLEIWALPDHIIYGAYYLAAYGSAQQFRFPLKNGWRPLQPLTRLNHYFLFCFLGCVFGAEAWAWSMRSLTSTGLVVHNCNTP